jgi:hypothetical protein
MQEILIYGLEPGETRDYMETLLSTQCKTQSDIDKLKAFAASKGFHSFRVSTYNGEKPNFSKAVNV